MQLTCQRHQLIEYLLGYVVREHTFDLRVAARIPMPLRLPLQRGMGKPRAGTALRPYPPSPALIATANARYFSVIVTELIVIGSVGVERSGPVVGTSAIASATSSPPLTLPKIV